MRRVRLQFISHRNDRYSYADSVKMALEGGCKWIQLRIKDADDESFCQIAQDVRVLCKEANACFIVDDRVHLVRQIGADGVHLGKNDMPVKEARRVLGDKYIIGGTANTIDDVINLYADGVDYIGCGPFRFTTTKEKLSPTLGLDGYKAIVSEMHLRGIETPIVAIGGITLNDIEELASANIDGIALSGAILNANNPVDEMKRIIEKCNSIWKN